MEYSTLGNPQMNGMSDSSVVEQQTVKAQEAPQHLLDPVRIIMHQSVQILNTYLPLSFG